MAQNIILKKSSVLGRIPDSSDLAYGELALNYSDGKLYYKKSNNEIDFFLTDSNLDSDFITSRVSAGSLALTNSQISAVVDELTNDIKPLLDALYDIGDSVRTWKDLYLDSQGKVYFGPSNFFNLSKLNSILDSADVVSLINNNVTGLNSDQANTLIDAKIQIIDIGDIVGADGNSGQILKSLGNGNATWINQADLVRPHLVAGANITYDSATGVITADLSSAGLDSAAVTGIIDSAYIQARQADIFRDSAFITGIIDTAYIQARDRIRDSNFVQDIVDSAYVQLRQAAPTAAQVRPFMVAGANITYDSATGVISSTASGTLDSAAVIGIIDSAYIQARDRYRDSGFVTGLIDSSYINSRVTASTDSSTVNTLIDAKIQVIDIGDVVGADGNSGQVLKSLGNGNSTWVNTSTFVTLDSSTLTSGFAGNIIPATDSTYDLGDSTRRWRDLYLSGNTIYLGDSAVLTAAKVNLIPSVALDSSIISSIAVTAAGGIDSALTISLIDSAYVQARQTVYLDSSTVQGVISAAYIQANQTTYSNADFADSAFVTAQINNLIDGAPGALNTLNELAAALNDDSDAYNTLLSLINANTSAVAGKLDSALTISLIDSAYIAARTTSGTDSAAVNTLIDAKIQVIDIGDVVGADGNSGQLLKSLGNGNSTWVNAADIVRPQLVAGSNITYDSATGVISSSASGVDSALTSQLIDSAYVQLRQIKYSTADFVDSAYVTTQINNLIDGAPGALNTLNELAAALNDDSQAYNTLLALINANTTAVAGKLDSALTTQLINAAYIQANQTNFLDSALTTQLISAAYIQANQTTYDFLDSAEVISLIDSAYIAARTTSGTDSASVNSLIDAKIQVIDIGDVVGADGNSGQLLKSLGNGNSTWVDAFDSTAVSGILSGYAGNIVPSADSTYSLGSPTKKWKDLYLSGNTIYFGDSVTLSAQQVQYIPTSVATVVDSASVRALFTSAGDLNYNESTGTFSLTVSSVVDSAYIAARSGAISSVNNNFNPGANQQYSLGDSNNRWKDLYLSDSSIIFGTTATLTAAKINLIPTVLLDSAIIKNTIIDAAYIQANQTTYSTADFVDSAYVTTQINNLIDAAPGALNTLNELAAALGDDANFSTTITNQIAGKLDSSLTTQLIDSSYIQLRQAAPTASQVRAFLVAGSNVTYDSATGVISASVSGGSGINSDQANTLIDASIQAIDIDDFTNVSGTNGYFLKSLGNREATWATIPASGLDSSAAIALIDSAYIQARQTDIFRDSAFITGLIDSAYIQAKQSDIFRDSAFVTGIVDTAYIQARDRIRDSNFVQDIVDSAYVQLRQAAPTAAQVRAFLVAGSNITYDSASGVISSTASGSLDSAGAIALIDSAYIQARQSSGGGGGIDSAAANILIDASIQAIDIDDFTNVSGTNGYFLKSLGNREATWATIPASGLDSAAAITLIDSAYIQARQADIYRDSAFVTGIVNASYIQSNQTNFLDSSLTTQLINAAYIQANQTTYSTADFVDSAYVTAQINSLIDGAPGTLDTLNEIAAAINDDANAYTTLVGLINAMPDSSWITALPVSTFSNDANYLDSTTVQGVISSSYIQTNQTTYSTADFPDSAGVITLIAANETTYSTADFTDSAYVATQLATIDSAYVQLRQAAPTAAQVRAFLVAGSNITYDSATGVISSTASGGVDSAAANSLIDAKIQVLDIGDVVGDDGNSGQLLKSLGNGNSTWVNAADIVRPQLVAGSNITYDSATGVISSTASGTLDSNAVIGIVDSAYIQARQADIFRDSAFITGIISSSYIQSNQTNFLDSALTTQLISAAYIQANQTTYSTADFPDSAYVTTQINNLIDGAPGALNTLNELAAALNDDSQAYNTLLALINSNTTAIAGKLDSALTISLIDSAYVAARSSAGSSGLDSAAANSLIDAKIQVIDIGDVVGTDGTSGQILKSLGNGSSTWIDQADLVRPHLVAGSNITYDSSTGVISSTASGGGLDSAGAIALIDSAYIQARQTDVYRDSAFVTGIVTASYIQSNQTTYSTADFVDSAYVTTQLATIDSAYVQLRQAAPTASQVRAFLVAGSNITYDSASGVISSTASGGSGLDSAAANILIDASIQAIDIDDFTNVSGTNGYFLKSIGNREATWATIPASGLDSASVISLIDSAYIQAKQSDIFRDSAFVTGIIDTAYIQARDRIRDSNFVQDIADSAYVQLRQAAPTASQVRAFLVAGSNITYDSASGVISSTASGSLDSAGAIALIDSAYVQLRQAVPTAAQVRPFLVAGSNITYDSATGVISSTASGGGSGIDSAAANLLIDASIQAIDIDDFTNVSGTNGKFLKSVGNREATWATVMDSSGVSGMLSSYAGNIVPALDSTYDLGSSSKKWKDLWLSGSTIHLGTAKLKAAADGNLEVFDSTGTTRKSLQVDELIIGTGTNKIKLRKSGSGRFEAKRFNSTTDTEVDSDATNVIVVKVSGSAYQLDGTTRADTFMSPNVTYRFDQSHSSNSGHRLAISTTSDGTHNSGAEITGASVYNQVGTPGSSGAYTEIAFAAGNTKYYYYCESHSGYGGTINTHPWSAISVTDAGGDGSLTMSTKGVITYTGPSASEVRAHIDSSYIQARQAAPTAAQVRPFLVAGSNITYDSATGVISSTASGGGGSGGLDSAAVISLVDSAYVQLRQSAGGGGGGSQNVFSTIAVSGQSSVVADTTTDTLTLVAGSNITLTTNASTDTITIASSGGGGGGASSLIFTMDQFGTLATTTGTARWYAPFDLTVSKIIGRVDSAPTGGSIDSSGIEFRIHRYDSTGSSIDTLMAINNGSYNVKNTSPTLDSAGGGGAVTFTMNEDDYLLLDVEKVGSTLPGQNLKVTFVYS